MSEKPVFDQSHESIIKLFELHPKGVVFRCPICDCDLDIALTNEEAKEKQIHPGVYCPTDSSHVCRMFNISGDREAE